MRRRGSAESAILPPLQGISVNNAPRGQKRGLSAEREENATKWQSLCSAPWSIVFEGAVDSLARQMHLSDESAVPPKGIRYQHEFCWGDKRMGTLNPDMVFIVKGTRIKDVRGQYKYVLIPGLKISGRSQNNWLWETMVEAFGPHSVSRTVACSDSIPLLKEHLQPLLSAWVQFFALNFETSV
jgi:hypothetical protein